MTDILIVWEKDRKGRYVPKTMYSCDICGSRFDTEESAEKCEACGGFPKFNKGDKVHLKYKTDNPVMDCQLTINSVRAIRPQSAVPEPHWWIYTVVSSFRGDLFEVYEREIEKEGV